jgi:amino-acid N-acetyltransferase
LHLSLTLVDTSLVDFLSLNSTGYINTHTKRTCHYRYTGFVRRVEVEKIRQLHNSRDICLLTTLGVSPSGEVFNVNSECLAASVAGALEASKIIYFTEKEMELRHKVHDNKIQSLRLSDARRLLEYHGISCHKKGFVTMTRGEEEKDDDSNSDDSEPENKQKQGDKVEMTRDARDMLLRIGWSIQALEQGVKRAHIISPKFGAVLQELYTRDGSGTLVSGDLYEGIRRATVHDVSGIHELISPLIQAGTLIDRPKATLEKDVDMYYVYTRDNHIVACGQLKIFEQGFAEIGCLVVNAGTFVSLVQAIDERRWLFDRFNLILQNRVRVAIVNCSFF